MVQPTEGLTRERIEAIVALARRLPLSDEQVVLAYLYDKLIDRDAEIGRLQASLDRMHGRPFSERVYNALFSRAETAEKNLIELRDAAFNSPCSFDRQRDGRFCSLDNPICALHIAANKVAHRAWK